MRSGSQAGKLALDRRMGSSFIVTGWGGGGCMDTDPCEKVSWTFSDCFYFPSEIGSKESATSEDMEVVRGKRN